jgi:malate dehydrogenase (quinone)
MPACQYIGGLITEPYDVIIVGGGVTGTALAYTLSRYTNAKRLLLIEKYSDIATLNSNGINNAQTLHVGDVETNYSLEESKHVKESASKLSRYAAMLPEEERGRVIQPCQKMVLGVGDNEVKVLEGKYDDLKTIFPGLKKIGRAELEKIEPNTIKGRDPKESVLALLSDTGYMMNFGLLAKSFLSRAEDSKQVRLDVKLNTKALSVKAAQLGHSVVTNNGTFEGRFVVFAAGTYSLYFAKQIGYNENLSILSVGGGFYVTPRVLNGKVYRVEEGGIPFAAVHGDPDITDPNITRFGPTVNVPLELEVRKPGTFMDYMKTFNKNLSTAESLLRILGNKDISRILRLNISYKIPAIGQYLFLKHEAARIVPSLKYSDLKFDRRVGGIRPQIIDENLKSFTLGASKIRGEGMLFIITPSPGASSSLQSALDDTMHIAERIGLRFDRERCESELGPINDEHLRIKAQQHKQM